MRPSASSAPRPVLGIAFKLGSVVLFSGMTVCVKMLGQAVPAGQTIFVRGLISMAVMALIAWQTGRPELLKTGNWRSHALRSLSGTVSMFCLFVGVTMIPLADATAISFTAPMFLTVLAMVFLGERIHRFRWTALGIGFLGVMIMIGPHLSLGAGASSQQQLGALIALSAALFSAIAMTFLRKMSVGEHAITITFYFSLTFTVCSALTSLLGWVQPTSTQWLLIVLAGLFGVFGQLLMTYSYRYAEASTIAPLDYSNMVMAIILGYVFFGEIPALSVWIGAPLVVGAGLIILWREYLLKKRLISASPET
ncbi:DMT family transporter [Steroidobacter sp. S1-65]|uniref:DMT family transporter n=1 Tax=Steroidobacter gossypii TaxID=2805490 RepID=A0ABS1WYE9_9GAMM|nr:DMT family transporter [Steroidobacter gossypii]MBM0106004.1 DMT family transporter [Steroidobacter gossypii]